MCHLGRSVERRGAAGDKAARAAAATWGPESTIIYIYIFIYSYIYI